MSLVSEVCCGSSAHGITEARLSSVGKHWSPGRPEDVPLQRPQDIP